MKNYSFSDTSITKKTKLDIPQDDIENHLTKDVIKGNETFSLITIGCY